VRERPRPHEEPPLPPLVGDALRQTLNVIFGRSAANSPDLTIRKLRKDLIAEANVDGRHP
jgi:hypothetical protein